MRISRQLLETYIRYEDDTLLVCHKPPFLAVESADVRQKDLVSLLKNRRLARRETPYIGVIHRLDQPVEGLVLLAKTKEAAAILSGQLQTGKISKEYVALVEKNGITLPQTGSLCHYIKKDSKTNLSHVADETDKAAKRAKLSYHICGETQEAYVVSIALETGRHHQIRVQFAATGHPLVGDEKYGARPVDGHSLALCANHLSFWHPRKETQMEFSIEPENELFRPYLFSK